MSLEEQVECPLCMEPLEMDDINFFPCTCGYQICRFCWHRIRTDENGLCPACRKPYQEDPAEFKPLTEDELQRIKKERRQKDLQRKQKAAENRKHLANVRVVQKNLVFVVGLSQRLADPEVLKKHEYFGKFGKIHKVVINQSTSYAGAQGPSASAYVTYNRPEDALRAIQAVNNIFVDGRTIKASLGTTKYCSHFLRGAQCPKPDCMYLHELGEEAASFTKEEMQQGKHQEYEQKLCDQYVNNPTPAQSVSTATTTSTNNVTVSTTVPNTSKGQSNKRKTGSPPLTQQSHPPHHSNKDAWPSLGNNGNGKVEGGRAAANGHKALMSKQDVPPNRNKQNPSPHQSNGKTNPVSPTSQMSEPSPPLHTSSNSTEQLSPPLPSQPVASSVPPPPPPSRKVPFSLDNADSSLSLFSSNGFPTIKNPQPLVPPTTHIPPEDSIPTTEISDNIPVSYATDWQAAFGFGSSNANTDTHDDDLGFDPWRESSKALADLIEKEQVNLAYDHHTDRLKTTVPPPGFSSNNLAGTFNNPHTTEFSVQHPRDSHVNHHTQRENSKDLQEGLRALLPNINISFGTPPSQTLQQSSRSQAQQFMQPPVPQIQHKTIPHSPPDLTWDPAIVSSGNVADQNPSYVEEPHWMASLQHLTEIDTPAPNNRFPYMQSFPFRAPTWGAQTQHPPPGFQNPVRAPTQFPETHKLAGGLQ